MDFCGEEVGLIIFETTEVGAIIFETDDCCCTFLSAFEIRIVDLDDMEVVVVTFEVDCCCEVLFAICFLVCCCGGTELKITFFLVSPTPFLLAVVEVVALSSSRCLQLYSPSFFVIFNPDRKKLFMLII